MLVPVPTIDDFEAFNAELMRRCDEDFEREHYERGTLISELWDEDKSHLLSLPAHEYTVFRYESLPVKKRFHNGGYREIRTLPRTARKNGAGENLLR